MRAYNKVIYRNVCTDLLAIANVQNVPNDEVIHNVYNLALNLTEQTKWCLDNNYDYNVVKTFKFKDKNVKIQAFHKIHTMLYFKMLMSTLFFDIEYKHLKLLNKKLL